MNPYYELTEMSRNGIQYVTIYVHCSALMFLTQEIDIRKLLHCNVVNKQL